MSLKKPLALVETYGCQQNEADSERLRGVLRSLGYDLTENEREADFIIINTCGVREHAAGRVYGRIGELSHIVREKPETIIAVCGCMTRSKSVREKLRDHYHHVRLVMGVSAYTELPHMLAELKAGTGRLIDVPAPTKPLPEDVPAERQGFPHAWITIMSGCDNFCAYCIVPYARGRERSRTPEAIEDELRGLIAEGFSDFTLLGQNVNAYGRGTDTDFPALLRRLAALPGEFTLRFMTSHPRYANTDMLEVMASSPKIPHELHLPAQCGSDAVLAAMRRGYTRAEYMALVSEARRLMPDIRLTSDIIVGFPGETEDDFEMTLELLREVRFNKLFMFIYSPREGTLAAKMDGQIPAELKKARFLRLTALQKQIETEL